MIFQKPNEWMSFSEREPPRQMKSIFLLKQKQKWLCSLCNITRSSIYLIIWHLSFEKEFKGSSVAESFQCGRTKTVAIVNSIGDYFFEKLKTDMKDLPFSLMLDASNDNGVEKMFPITVRIFDIEFNRFMTKFFDINLIEGRDSSTAACMFQSVDDMLVFNDIHWD